MSNEVGHDVEGCEFCGTRGERVLVCVSCPERIDLAGVWVWSPQGKTHYIEPDNRKEFFRQIGHHVDGDKHAFVPEARNS